MPNVCCIGRRGPNANVQSFLFLRAREYLMGELLRNFGVDWKLLFAQVVNFAVLFWVLKRFAYGPVLAMLSNRRKEIEKGIAMRAEAEKNLKEIEHVRSDTVTKANQEALAIVKHAEGEAEGRKEEILADASRKGNALLEQAHRGILQEREKMGESVVREAEELVKEGIARVLGQMPPHDRDRELIRAALAAVRAAKSV